MSYGQWLILYEKDEHLRCYGTAYTPEQVHEFLKDCQAKYGNAKAERANKYVPIDG